MSPRRRAAVGLWVALTFSFAVLVHGVLHAVGSRSFEWDSPAHVAMTVAALALLGLMAWHLGAAAPASERRRRVALLRAELRPIARRTVLAGAALQAAIAVLLLLAEGQSLDANRVVPAIFAALLALLCSALLLRAARDRVVALLVAFAEAVAFASPPYASRRLRPARVARAGIAFRLFVPNRAPPAFAR